MLFSSIAFSVVVKRLILYGTYPEAISLQTSCTIPCWSLTAARRAALSFVPWIPGAACNSGFLYRGIAMSPAGCPSPQLQPTESSPSGCSGLGSACSWGLSCWHCQPSKQPGHFFSLWYQSLSHGFIPYSFLSPWERPWGLWFFLYICHLICSGSELLCAHNLWVEYLGWDAVGWYWFLLLRPTQAHKVFMALGVPSGKLVWHACSNFPPSHFPVFSGTP